MNNKILKLLKKIIVFSGAVLVLVFLFFLFERLRQNVFEGSLDDFAKCLTEKGVIFYGNYNCPHCQNEKKAFGAAFKFIRYIECTENPQICVSAGIEKVPTWIFPDGKRLVGAQGIKNLSKESGCPITK